MSREELSASHVRSLIDDFDKYVEIYDHKFPFRKAKQASSHVHTLQLRVRCGSVKAAIDDAGFVDSLYETLQAWGIGRRGSRLVPLSAFRDRLRAHSGEVAALEGMAIDDAGLAIDRVVAEGWRLIDSLGVVENDAPVVAGTKTLHHLLPDLVPPMDRAYTRPFFGWYGQQFQYQQQRVFEGAMRSFWEIAVKVQPRRLQGGEWRTSLAKLLDNAVVAFVRENGIKRA